MASAPGLIADMIDRFVKAGLYTRRDFKCKNGMFRFRCSHYIGAVGIVGMLFTFAVTIAAITDSSQLSAKLFLVTLFTLLSMPILLLYLVARVWIDEDKLVCRNPIGIKKVIYWCDVNETYNSRDGGELIVCAGKKKVWLYACFKGFCIIESVVEEKNSANPLHTGRSEYDRFARDDGTVILRGRKLYAIIGGIILLLAVGCLFIPMGWGEKALLAALFAIPGVFIMMLYLMLRLDMDADKVTYRDIFGRTKAIRWQDLKRVCGEKSFGQSCITFVSKDNRKIRIYEGYLDGYNYIFKFIRRFQPKKKQKIRKA